MARPEAPSATTAAGQTVPAGDPLGAARALQLVLLDFGLAEELSPSVRHHFISFLHCIASGAPSAYSPGMHHELGFRPSRQARASGCSQRRLGVSKATLLGLPQRGHPSCCLQCSRTCFRSGDGLRAAEHMLQMGNNEACPDRAGFLLDMTELFSRFAIQHLPNPA